MLPRIRSPTFPPRTVPEPSSKVSEPNLHLGEKQPPGIAVSSAMATVDRDTKHPTQLSPSDTIETQDVQDPELHEKSTTAHDHNTKHGDHHDVEKGPDRSKPGQDDDSQPFSIFTKGEKWALIFIGSMASLFRCASSYRPSQYKC